MTENNDTTTATPPNYGYGYGYGYDAPEPVTVLVKPKWYVGRWMFGAVGLALGASLASCGGGGGDVPAATVTATVTAAPVTVTAPAVTVPAATPPPAAVTTAPAPAVAAAAAPGMAKDGTYMVGTDVEAGTYKTTGPAEGGIGMCYWARLQGTSGELEDIIANDLPTGQTTVTIKTTDKAFETTGCAPWTKVS